MTETEVTEANQITPEQQEAAFAAGFDAERGVEIPPEVAKLNTEATTPRLLA